MGRGVFFVLLFVMTVSAQGQTDTAASKRDLIDVFIHLFHIHASDSTRAKHRFIFSLIPAAPANLGQKQALVSSLNVAFYTGNPAMTNLSSVYFVPYTNFSTRSGIIVTPNIWLPHNRWNLNGDLRISKNSNYTYGLGANSPDTARDVIDYGYIRTYVNASYKLRGYFNVGLGFNFDDYYHVTDEKTNGYPDVFSRYGSGTGSKTLATGISFNLLYDTRRNSINPDDGLYASLSFRINPGLLSNDYIWRSVYFDARKYVSFSTVRHSLLGFWLLYWGCYGDVPYLNLPGTAEDAGGRTGRGYALGRYRGKQMLYGESEYRCDLSADGFWGMVVFCNLQSYTQPGTGRFAWFLPAAGTGLRIKFNKRNDMNLTLDVAVGKNMPNWYLNLGEFF